MTRLADAPVPRGLPAALEGARWFGASCEVEVSSSGASTLAAPAASDWFHDPTKDTRVRSAPMLLAPFEGPASLRATVQVDHRGPFDAGVLMVFEDDETWAKACFERAPDGRNLVVTVVTRGHSDDANAFEVAGDTVHLRISHLGASYAVHASVDGDRWEFVRHMRLTGAPRAWWGIGVQAPVGGGCSATFTDVQVRRERRTDLRDGG